MSKIEWSLSSIKKKKVSDPCNFTQVSKPLSVTDALQLALFLVTAVPVRTCW